MRSELDPIHLCIIHSQSQQRVRYARIEAYFIVKQRAEEFGSHNVAKCIQIYLTVLALEMLDKPEFIHESNEGNALQKSGELGEHYQLMANANSEQWILIFLAITFPHNFSTFSAAELLLFGRWEKYRPFSMLLFLL